MVLNLNFIEERARPKHKPTSLAQCYQCCALQWEASKALKLRFCLHLPNDALRCCYNDG